MSKIIKTDGTFNLYKEGNGFVLWHGNKRNGAQVGYVSDAENFEYAVMEAKEEIRYLMEELY